MERFEVLMREDFERRISSTLSAYKTPVLAKMTPIEILFHWACGIFLGDGSYYLLDNGGTETTEETISILDAMTASKTLVNQQCPISANNKKYRVDFLIEWLDQKLIVECDGHEFHKATKEQARNDYVREQDLKLSGYDLIRFAGTQIWEDPHECVEKSFQHMLNVYLERKTKK